MSAGTAAPPEGGGADTRRGRAPHPLWSEARRSVARWALPAAVLLVGGGMFADSGRWQGSWDLTVSQLCGFATMLGGPLAAAVGCWQGGRERRNRTEGLRPTGSRGPLAGFLVVAVPPAAALVAGLALAAAAVLAACAPYASAGAPQVAQLAPAAALLVALCLCGTVVGRLLPRRLTAPLAAVTAYALLGAATREHGAAAAQLSPSSVDSLMGYLVAGWQPAVMSVWLLALTATVVLPHAGGRARVAALAAVAVAVAAAVPLVSAGRGVYHRDELTRRQVCTAAAPRICVPEAFRGMLPQVAAAGAGVRARLAGVPGAPARFVTGTPGPGETQLPDLYLGQSVVRGRLTDPQRYAWETAAQVVGTDCDAPSRGPSDDAVSTWLAGNALGLRRLESGRPPYVAAARRALGRLRAMPPDTRRAWLGRYLADVRACRRTPAP